MSSPKAPSEPAFDTAERRPLTVMFCDLLGSTELAHRLDPEDLREAVRSYQDECREVIAQHGGQVAQYLGDGILAYFGFPSAHEDDPVRAVDAGLGILERIAPLNDRLARRGLLPDDHLLAVRIAIHTGPAVVGEMGPSGSQERLALGPTPNVAARLEAVAEPGTVVISDTTRRLVEGVFVVEDLGIRSLKGVTKPVGVARVLRASGLRSRLDLARNGGLTPFVGREQEIDLLLDRWESVRGGAGVAVLIEAEPGLGKSRLVQVLRERLAPAAPHWLEGRCSPYRVASAFHPLVDMLGRELGRSADEGDEQAIASLEQALASAGLSVERALPPLARLLGIDATGRWAGPPEGQEAEGRHVSDALADWVCAHARRGPAILVLEDLHWIDPSSTDLVEMLLERISAIPLLLVLTSRPGFAAPWLEHPRLARLPVHSLTRRQVAFMIENLDRTRKLPAGVVRRIAETADGIPLFVEELTRAVLDADQGGAGGAELPERIVPPTLEASLMARLDRLGEAKTVAQVASVIGREFSRPLLRVASAFPPAPLDRALERLVEAGLLHELPSGDFSFKHVLIQNAAYESLLRSTRRECHRRIALGLEERGGEAEPEIVAHHYEQAELLEPAVRHYQAAGERSIRRSANPEAIRHLSKALSLLQGCPASPERDAQELVLRVTLGAPIVAARGFASPELAETYERARELCRRVGDEPQLFQALFGLSAFYEARGHLDTALELAGQLLAISERSADPSHRIEANMAAGMPRYWKGEWAAALAHFEAAMAICDAEASLPLASAYGVDPAVASRVFAALACWYLGRPERARGLADDAVALGRLASHPYSVAYALCFSGTLFWFRGEPAAVLERAEEAMGLAEEQPFPMVLSIVRMLRGWALAASGSVASGLAETERAAAEFEATGFRVGAPHFAGSAAQVYGHAGRLRDAIEAVQHGLAAAAHGDQHYWDAELHRLEGEIRLGCDEPPFVRSESLFQRAIEIARAQQARSLELRASTSLLRLQQSRGDADPCRRLVARCLAEFPEPCDAPDLVEAHRLLAST